MTRPIDLDSVVVAAPGLMVSENDDGMVVFDVDHDTYIGLDRIASRVWALLARPTSMASICEQLKSEYDVDADTCRNDVLKCLTDMHIANLIHVAPR